MLLSPLLQFQNFADRMTEIKDALDTAVAANGEADAASTAAAGDAPSPSSPASSSSKSKSKAPPATLEEREALLEELTDIVSSIDYARDLHKIGGLGTLMALLASSHPSLRWRAAEVVATCVQARADGSTYISGLLDCYRCAAACGHECDGTSCIRVLPAGRSFHPPCSV